MMTLDAIARWIVPGLLNGIWQSLLIAGIAAFALHYVRTSASTRYVVWFLILIATVMLPFLPPRTSVKKIEAVQIQPVAATVQNEPVTGTLAPKIPVRVARIILLFWFGGAAIQITRLLIGLRRLFQLKRNTVELQVSGQYARDARIYSSENCTTPVVIGFKHPVILIPAKLAFSLPSADMNRILQHELAHILRRDDWTQLAQRMVEALFFFHPVILWIGRKLILEREIACDDHVVKNQSDIRSYAKSLIQLAEMSFSSIAPAALAIFSQKNQLSRRIDMLLISNRNRSVRVSKSGAALVILLLSAFFLLVAQVSPGIAVSEKETTAPNPKRESVKQAEEELRRATEEMKRTSEKMQQALQQMNATIEELRALTKEKSVPVLAPLPEIHPLPPMAPLTHPLPAPATFLTPATLPTPETLPETLPTPKTLPAPAIVPLPPATVPMPPDAKIIDPIPEVPEDE